MSTVNIRVKGYAKPHSEQKIEREFTLDDQFAVIEVEYAGAEYRISPASLNDKHGIEGIEIMERDGYGLAVRPIVSNVVVVTRAKRS